MSFRLIKVFLYHPKPSSKKCFLEFSDRKHHLKIIDSDYRQRFGFWQIGKVGWIHPNVGKFGPLALPFGAGFGQYQIAP